MTTPFEIFNIKKITFQEIYWQCEFVNFTQYCALSFPLGQFICSIVYPKPAQIIIDIQGIQHWFRGQINP